MQTMRAAVEWMSMADWRALARRRQRHQERGQGMMEYVLVVSVVSVALIGAFQALTANGVGPLYTVINNAFAAL